MPSTDEMPASAPPSASSRGRRRRRADPLAGSSYAPSSRLIPRLDLRELWDYRDVGLILAQRDLKVRYKQTFLGVLWALIQPLIAMVVFTAIFGRGLGISERGGALRGVRACRPRRVVPVQHRADVGGGEPGPQPRDGHQGLLPAPHGPDLGRARSRGRSRDRHGHRDRGHPGRRRHPPAGDPAPAGLLRRRGGGLLCVRSLAGGAQRPLSRRAVRARLRSPATLLHQPDRLRELGDERRMGSTCSRSTHWSG